eukprot:gene15382-21468_t
MLTVSGRTGLFAQGAPLMNGLPVYRPPFKARGGISEYFAESAPESGPNRTLGCLFL